MIFDPATRHDPTRTRHDAAHDQVYLVVREWTEKYLSDHCSYILKNDSYLEKWKRDTRKMIRQIFRKCPGQQLCSWEGGCKEKMIRQIFLKCPGQQLCSWEGGCREAAFMPPRLRPDSIFFSSAGLMIRRYLRINLWIFTQKCSAKFTTWVFTQNMPGSINQRKVAGEW
jgi:hypothetical protein